MALAAERREQQFAVREIEKGKVAKAKAEEQKTRDKKAKDLILEMKANQVLINEKRTEAKEKVTTASKTFISKMKERDAKMQAEVNAARKVKEQERRALQETNFQEDMKAMEKARKNKDLGAMQQLVSQIYLFCQLVCVTHYLIFIYQALE